GISRLAFRRVRDRPLSGRGPARLAEHARRDRRSNGGALDGAHHGGVFDRGGVWRSCLWLAGRQGWSSPCHVIEYSHLFIIYWRWLFCAGALAFGRLSLYRRFGNGGRVGFRRSVGNGMLAGEVSTLTGGNDWRRRQCRHL